MHELSITLFMASISNYIYEIIKTWLYRIEILLIEKKRLVISMIKFILIYYFIINKIMKICNITILFNDNINSFCYLTVLSIHVTVKH